MLVAALRAHVTGSCARVITTGHVAVGLQQKSRWNGLPDHGWVHTLYGSFLRSQILFLCVMLCGL